MPVLLIIALLWHMMRLLPVSATRHTIIVYLGRVVFFPAHCRRRREEGLPLERNVVIAKSKGIFNTICICNTIKERENDKGRERQIHETHKRDWALQDFVDSGVQLLRLSPQLGRRAHLPPTKQQTLSTCVAHCSNGQRIINLYYGLDN